MAIMDIVAKQIYSVTLLTGNFCIMDVVSTLRLNQVLQSVAGCCSVLQCVAVRHLCETTIYQQQGAAVRCSVLQCVAVCCSALQCVALCHLCETIIY